MAVGFLPYSEEGSLLNCWVCLCLLLFFLYFNCWVQFVGSNLVGSIKRGVSTIFVGYIFNCYICWVQIALIALIVLTYIYAEFNYACSCI